MTNRIFVGNLPFRIDAATLADLFARFGEIATVVVAADKLTGRTKGFAIIEFATDESAGSAVTALQGIEIDGRILVINQQREYTPRRIGDSGSAGNEGGESPSDAPLAANLLASLAVPSSFLEITSEVNEAMIRHIAHHPDLLRSDQLSAV